MSVHSKPPGTPDPLVSTPHLCRPSGLLRKECSCSAALGPQEKMPLQLPTASGAHGYRLQVGGQAMGPEGPGGRSQRPRLSTCVDLLPQDAARATPEAHGLRILVKGPSCGVLGGKRAATA